MLEEDNHGLTSFLLYDLVLGQEANQCDQVQLVDWCILNMDAADAFDLLRILYFLGKIWFSNSLDFWEDNWESRSSQKDCSRSALAMSSRVAFRLLQSQRYFANSARLLQTTPTQTVAASVAPIAPVAPVVVKKRSGGVRGG